MIPPLKKVRFLWGLTTSSTTRCACGPPSPSKGKAFRRSHSHHATKKQAVRAFPFSRGGWSEGPDEVGRQHDFSVKPFSRHAPCGVPKNQTAFAMSSAVCRPSDPNRCANARRDTKSILVGISIAPKMQDCKQAKRNCFPKSNFCFNC